MEAPKCRAKEPSAWHADKGVACDDRYIRHESQLESSAQCVATYLGHGHFRVPLKVVVKLERPSINGQLAALARSTVSSVLFPVAIRLLRLGAVPGIGIVHIGAGAEDTTFTSQYHDFDVVVIRSWSRYSAICRRMAGSIRIATILIVNGESGDARVPVMIEQYSGVSQRQFPSQFSPAPFYQISFRCLMGISRTGSQPSAPAGWRGMGIVGRDTGLLG